MRTIKTIILSLTVLSIVVACGGNAETNEAKQAKLEKLKLEQASLSSKIKALEDEIKSSGSKIENHEKVSNIRHIGTIGCSKCI
ncbi:MAG: hypothetical protein NTU43_03895 [Bacteroidetes bacterium]|nr:hypothetical protein [Bacteroidota bacterium]